MTDYDMEMANFVYVTDRGSSLISALKEFDRLSCSAHILNNILNAATNDSDEFKKLLDKCKYLVKYFKKSTHLQWKLNKTLKSAGQTRWNSNFTMLKSIKDNYTEVCQVLENKNQMTKVEDIHVHTINEAIIFLEHFQSVIEQATSKPTLYLCITYYYKLVSVCRLSGAENSMIKQLKENINNKLTETWLPEIKTHHIAATFLYPKCKKLPMFSVEQKEEVQEFIVSISNRLAISEGTVVNETTQTTDDDTLFDVFLNQDESEADSIRGKYSLHT